jgi:hypothetical protein
MIQKTLDKLFSGVANDTPTLERDELRQLLSEKKSRVGTRQTFFTRRFLTKGFITMSISAILITTVLFLLYSNNTQTNALKSVAEKTSSFSSIEQPRKEELLMPEKIGKLESQTSLNDSDIRFHGFDQIDLSCVHPVPISSDQMERIGIFREISGDISFYHQDGPKVGFPLSKYSRPFDHYEKELRYKQLNNAKIFPSYATDSRGNLLMIYQFHRDSNGMSSNLRLPEAEQSILHNLNYYRLPSYVSYETLVDSSKVPWIITSHYHIKIGIMTLDTTMSYPQGSDETKYKVQEIWERLAFKDSTYKMKFGGEKGLREKFQFPTDYEKLTPFERILQTQLDSIAKTGSNRKQVLENQLARLSGFIDSDFPDSVKLQLEQLSHKIEFEYSTLEHMDQEQQLANITSLVPLKIRENTGMKADGKYDNGLIFWYEPTKELFAALPQLQRELSAEACTQSAEQKLTNVSLYPNPASMYLFLNYTLAASENVHASILDLSGKTVSENIVSRIANSGVNKESITLGDIAPGVYILRLTTDSGEQSIQRLVITR